MAQFSHADFGGMSQWSPGMSMVGDMFNTHLNPSSTRFVPTQSRPVGAVALRRTASAIGRCPVQPIGGRPAWGGLERWARKTTCAMRSSLRAGGWC
jgi:hypothetical protein